MSENCAPSKTDLNANPVCLNIMGHWDMILSQNGVLSALPYVVMVVAAGVASREVSSAVVRTRIASNISKLLCQL